MAITPYGLRCRMSYLVVEVQHVGAVSPLGEDDGVLLLPLQTATLGDLAGLRGDVVLRRQRREFSEVTGLLQRTPSVCVLCPTSPFTVHSTIERNCAYGPGIVCGFPPYCLLRSRSTQISMLRAGNGPVTRDST